MLLQEIISTDRIVKAKGRPNLPSDPIGEGLFARVYPGRKTNTVIKVADASSPNDAYINFVREALDHQDNPFFPRIYNAKLYESGKRGYTFIVEMEKLIPLDDKKISDASAHLVQQLGIDMSDIITSTGEAGEPSVMKFSGRLIDHFESRPGRNKLREASDNEQFIEALNAFERLLQSGHQPDVHGKNIMVRQTSVGPQLVLTDPVAY